MGIHRQQLQNTGGEFTETATQTQWYSRVHIYSYVIQHNSPQVLEHGTHVHVQDNMCAHLDLCNSYVLEGIAQVQFCTTQNLVHICLNMYVYKWRPSWNTKHQNLISHSMTAPLPVLSPSSILLPHVSALPLPKEISLLYFFKNCVCLKLHSSGNVCTAKS